MPCDNQTPKCASTFSCIDPTDKLFFQSLRNIKNWVHFQDRSYLNREQSKQIKFLGVNWCAELLLSKKKYYPRCYSQFKKI